MNIVPAQEIKRRGITAVDEALAHGPVHILKHNRAQYVVLSEAHYRELLDSQEEAELARLKTSLDDSRRAAPPGTAASKRSCGNWTNRPALPEFGSLPTCAKVYLSITSSDMRRFG